MTDDEAMKLEIIERTHEANSAMLFILLREYLGSIARREYRAAMRIVDEMLKLMQFGSLISDTLNEFERGEQEADFISMIRSIVEEFSDEGLQEE